MGKIRWYQRDPNAALTGMANLSLEERGAYNTVLDLMYTHDGALDDDAHYIAGWLRSDVRVWKRIRERLLSLGKIYKVGGKLRNERCDLEVDKALGRLASSVQAGLASAASRGFDTSKNKHLASSRVERPLEQPTTRKKESSFLASGSLARLPDGALRSHTNIEASDSLKRLVAAKGWGK